MMDEQTENIYEVRQRSCARCQRSVVADMFFVVCDQCRPLYPPALLKAANDEFDYALRLVTGEIVRFSSADIHGDYVNVKGTGYGDSSRMMERVDFTFERGVDVRLDSIVWCADAPMGS